MRTKYIPTPTINHVDELIALKLKRGQWIKLAWCEKKSRFDRVKLSDDGTRVMHVTAFHYPRASTVYWNRERQMTARPLALFPK